MFIVISLGLLLPMNFHCWCNIHVLQIKLYFYFQCLSGACIFGQEDLYTQATPTTKENKTKLFFIVLSQHLGKKNHFSASQDSTSLLHVVFSNKLKQHNQGRERGHIIYQNSESSWAFTNMLKMGGAARSCVSS